MMKVERDSNFELLRVFSMFAILIGHFSSGIYSFEPVNTNNVLLTVLTMWGKTGINVFMLISGYFMCSRTITLRKYLKLIVHFFFYNFVIGGIFFITGYQELNAANLFNYIIPLRDVNIHSFVAAFLCFYLFIPFMNLLVRSLSKEMHLKLILLCVIIYVIVDTFPKFNINFDAVMWFCFLFLLASYIRLYGIYCGENKRFWGWMSIGTITFTCLSVAALKIVGIPYYYIVSHANSIMALLVSVSVFMFFKNVKLGKNKFINLLGGATFGVLLIHANSDTMRQWLWGDIVNSVSSMNMEYGYLYAIGCSIIVYICCTIIEIIRQKTIDEKILNLVYNITLPVYAKGKRMFQSIFTL